MIESDSISSMAASEEIVVRGYVVNVYDSVNYDIDFAFPHPHLRMKIWNSIINAYLYENETGEIELGLAYRCRLKGIKRTSKSRTPSELLSRVYVEVNQFFDLQDGWVTCTITGTDMYRRVLVDIDYQKKVPGENCSLRETLLKRYDSVFLRYIPPVYSDSVVDSTSLDHYLAQKLTRTARITDPINKSAASQKT